MTMRVRKRSNPHQWPWPLESPREVSLAQFCSPFTPPYWEISAGNIKWKPNLMLMTNKFIFQLDLSETTTYTQETCIKRLEQCIGEVRIWMTFNLLKPNDDKIELIMFGTLQQVSKIDEISITVGLESLQPVKCVQNLGYFMDCFIKNAHHINWLTRHHIYHAKWYQNHQTSPG